MWSCKAWFLCWWEKKLTRGGAKEEHSKSIPHQKTSGMKQTVELNSAAVVQIWHTINQSELWGFYWSEKLMTQTNCWLSELGRGKRKPNPSTHPLTSTNYTISTNQEILQKLLCKKLSGCCFQWGSWEEIQFNLSWDLFSCSSLLGFHLLRISFSSSDLLGLISFFSRLDFCSRKKSQEPNLLPSKSCTSRAERDHGFFF